jgi:hypothetical protein
MAKKRTTFIEEQCDEEQTSQKSLGTHQEQMHDASVTGVGRSAQYARDTLSKNSLRT